MIADHPLAAVFPLLSDAELLELGEDMKVNGQNHAIILFEAMILDGRNRYRACLLVGLDPRFEEYSGNDPVAFVISENVRRRHLTESQRAMAAAELEKLEHGGKRHESKGSPSQDATLHLEKTRADIAEQMDVSPRTVAAAKKVKEEAEPEIVEAVKAGKLPVSTAAKAATLPKKKQRQIAASEDPAKAAREEVKKAEEKEEPAADPLEAFVGELNRLCRLTDALKKEVEKAVNSHPLGKKFVHIESIATQLHAARSALWQSRPTEECNCVKRDKKPHPDCRACHSTGKCPAGRASKGGR